MIDNAYNNRGGNLSPDALVADETAQVAGAVSPAAVPEPASLGLLALGAAALFARRPVYTVTCEAVAIVTVPGRGLLTDFVRRRKQRDRLRAEPVTAADVEPVLGKPADPRPRRGNVTRRSAASGRFDQWSVAGHRHAII